MRLNHLKTGLDHSAETEEDGFPTFGIQILTVLSLRVYTVTGLVICGEKNEKFFLQILFNATLLCQLDLEPKIFFRFAPSKS